jgi:hypothetical protein
VLLLGRLLVQLLSLWRLRRTARPAVVHGQPVRVLTGAVSPFSFWQTIYLNPQQHPAVELDAVLRHEQVHVRQWHTLDVLLAQVALALAWCNPAAWLLRRALLDNLEYLADHAALRTGLDRRAYQYSLLRLSHGVAGPSLVSHFTFSSLKNRVAMMNTPFSSTGKLARYVVAGPLVLAVALGFSAARAQGAGPVVPAAASTATTVAPPAHSFPSSVRQYLAKTHPKAELMSYASLTEKEAAQSPFSYMAEIKENGVRRQLYFNAAGRPVTIAATSVEVKALTPAPSQPAPSHRSSSTRVEVQKLKTTPAKITGPVPIYYVDGKASQDAIGTINPNDIASISVLKGERARQLAGAAGASGAVVITTKQNQDRADVRAFNQQHGIAQPAPAAPEKAQKVSYLAAPALAYITKKYPDARLLGVTQVQAADKTPHYQAEIAIGRRPAYLIFDGQGQFVSESYTAR